jgi:hypothetical protein
VRPPNNPGGQQRIVEGALDAIRPGWRERRAKRKSPWNLLGAVVAVLLMGPAGYGLWLCAWRLHLIFYPAHAAHLQDFWQAGISGRAFISSFLLAMPLCIPAILIGLLVSNFLMWLIPPARRAMNAEAAGDEEMTFRGANLGLLKWGGVASGVSLLLVLIGAATLSSLR